jgi:hypothetical protein
VMVSKSRPHLASSAVAPAGPLGRQDLPRDSPRVEREDQRAFKSLPPWPKTRILALH